MSDIDIIPAAASVDEDSVTNALDGVSTATVATDDKVIIQDTSDSDALKTVTAQAIADLASGGGGAPTLYQNLMTTGTNATITNGYVNTAGSGLLPIPTTPVTVTSVVVGGTSDVIRVKFQGQASTSGNKLLGFRIGTGTPTFCRYMSGANIEFEYTITGIAAGTYTFELCAIGLSSTWTLSRPTTNSENAYFQVEVFPAQSSASSGGSSVNLSTTEQEAGFTDVSGNTVYQITVEGTISSASTSTRQEEVVIPATFAGVKLYGAEGHLTNSSTVLSFGHVRPSAGSTPRTVDLVVGLPYISSSSVRFLHLGLSAGAPYTLTIFYTKV